MVCTRLFQVRSTADVIACPKARPNAFGYLRRPWAFRTAVLGFVMLVIYVTLIVGQGGVSLFDVLPWALLMAIAAIAAFVTAQIEDWRIARTGLRLPSITQSAHRGCGNDFVGSSPITKVRRAVCLLRNARPPWSASHLALSVLTPSTPVCASGYLHTPSSGRGGRLRRRSRRGRARCRRCFTERSDMSQVSTPGSLQR